jgi:hypothetical protein
LTSLRGNETNERYEKLQDADLPDAPPSARARPVVAGALHARVASRLVQDGGCLRVLIAGAAVTDRMYASLQAAVSPMLAGRSDYGVLSVVLTRLVSGEWTVFITDGANLELADAELTARLVQALKETERRMDDQLNAEDRELLRAIARTHGHGPRRPVALLDIAWAERGSESAGRAALQRLLLFGYVALLPGEPSKEVLGTLTDKGAALIGYA